jgi:hypothetical protein
MRAGNHVGTGGLNDLTATLIPGDRTAARGRRQSSRVPCPLLARPRPLLEGIDLSGARRPAGRVLVLIAASKSTF